MARPKLGSVYDLYRVAELLHFQDPMMSQAEPPKIVEGFLIFFDPGLSIMQLRDAVKGKGCIFAEQSAHDHREFANLADRPCYRWLRMEAVKDSFRKTFGDQQKLLLPDEEVPLARVVVMGMVLHFLATGQRFFPNCFVRCLDKVSDDLRVFVGDFDDAGLRVSSSRDDVPLSSVGLASAGKS